LSVFCSTPRVLIQYKTRFFLIQEFQDDLSCIRKQGFYSAGMTGRMTSPLSSAVSCTPLFRATAVETAIRRYNPIVTRFSHQITYTGKKERLGTLGRTCTCERKLKATCKHKTIMGETVQKEAEEENHCHWQKQE